MRNIIVLLAVQILLGAGGALSASNVTVYMEDYVRENQRLYDANVKRFENELTSFRESYGRELRGIGVQADQLQLKIEEAQARLNPIELIDYWHKQCVLNYSAQIPLIATVRTALTSCSSVAQSNLNSILSSAQSTVNSLKSYYNNNFKSLLTDCEKRYPESQSNYTSCIKAAITTANAYTISSQKNFISYMQQAQCAADTRITQAWECAFTTVHSSSSALATALRLVDDCIANKLACASQSCMNSCPNHMTISVRDSDFLNATIKNPFYGLHSGLSCLEMNFKWA